MGYTVLKTDLGVNCIIVMLKTKIVMFSSVLKENNKKIYQ